MRKYRKKKNTDKQTIKQQTKTHSKILPIGNAKVANWQP